MDCLSTEAIYFCTLSSVCNCKVLLSLLLFTNAVFDAPSSHSRDICLNMSEVVLSHNGHFFHWFTPLPISPNFWCEKFRPSNVPSTFRALMFQLFLGYHCNVVLFILQTPMSLNFLPLTLPPTRPTPNPLCHQFFYLSL